MSRREMLLLLLGASIGGAMALLAAPAPEVVEVLSEPAPVAIPPAWAQPRYGVDGGRI